MEGQISVEMLIVVGVAILMISLYILYGYQAIYSYEVNNDVTLLKNSLKKIVNTAEAVSFQGKPAKQKIYVCFPSSLENCSISNKTISCILRSGSSIYSDSKTNLNGSLPGAGCWYLILSAEDNFVNITAS